MFGKAEAVPFSFDLNPSALLAGNIRIGVLTAENA
jgi:hypothetical protein